MKKATFVLLVLVLTLGSSLSWSALLNKKQTDKKAGEIKKEIPAKSAPAKSATETAASKVSKEIVLDGFEANDWLPASAEGTIIKTTLVPGMGQIGKSLQIDYDLKDSGQWIAIAKDISLGDVQGKSFRFYLKSKSLKTNNLEIKLIDEDGSTFGYKLPLDSADAWGLVTIDASDFSYWWGGDKTLGKVIQVGYAISAGNGGSGTVSLDDLRLASSSMGIKGKVSSGEVDNCDTLERWKIEGDGGTAYKLLMSMGKEKQAIGMEYDFGSGRWVQIFKALPIELTEKSVFKFYLKWTGEDNNLEFKVLDQDNSNFGKKMPLSSYGAADSWIEVKIPISELGYWWGGDDKILDMKNIKSVWFAVSVPKGGKGSLWLDSISLELLP